jgi:hypothetical protein
MDWNILGAVLSSSITAAFLTKGLDVYAEGISYKRDYYKKVIEERLEVYKKLNKVLYQAVGGITTGDNKTYNIIFSNSTLLYQFINDLITVANSRIWLSVETGHQVVDLIQFLAIKMVDSSISPTSSNIVFEEFGVLINNDFEKMKIKLEDRTIEDFSELHNVSAFFRSQKR